jgi:hypothetical protein
MREKRVDRSVFKLLAASAPECAEIPSKTGVGSSFWAQIRKSASTYQDSKMKWPLKVFTFGFWLLGTKK